MKGIPPEDTADVETASMNIDGVPEAYVISEKIPCFVITKTKEDAQLLTAGNYPSFEMNHAVQKYCKFDDAIPAINATSLPEEVLISFPWGASRIIALEGASAGNLESAEPVTKRTGSIIIPAPNLNVLYPSAAIPVINGTIRPGTTEWITAVRAGDREAVSSEKVPDVYDAIRFHG
jgi:hypothetical protein